MKHLIAKIGIGIIIALLVWFASVLKQPTVIEPVNEPTFGDDSGALHPSAEGSTHNEWVNGQNAYSSNNSYATYQNVVATGENNFTAFGFSIPAGATIDGILVEVEAKTSFSTLNSTVYVYSTTDTSWSAGKSQTINNTESYRSHGGAADTWGMNWASTDFSDANFNVYVSIAAGSWTAYVDDIRITVYYTPTDPCAYSGSGDWPVNLGDNCYVTSDLYVPGQLILYDNTGAGSLNIIDGAFLAVEGIQTTSTRAYLQIESDDGSELKIWTAQ